jgi:hypothetical protein
VLPEIQHHKTSKPFIFANCPESMFVFRNVSAYSWIRLKHNTFAENSIGWKRARMVTGRQRERTSAAIAA